MSDTVVGFFIQEVSIFTGQALVPVASKAGVAVGGTLSASLLISVVVARRAARDTDSALWDDKEEQCHLEPGVISGRCTGESLPVRVDFIHRVEFGEVSGHRVLIKRGPGNRGPTECGTAHEATSGMSS